jgi:hypothetical protein
VATNFICSLHSGQEGGLGCSPNIGAAYCELRDASAPPGDALAASFSRTQPWQPRASAHSRASACGPRGVSEGQGPHPGRANRRGVGLEDAADNRVPSATTSKSSSFHWPDGREADARLRISEDTTTRFQSSHSCSFPPMRRSLVLDVVPSRWRKC